MSEISPRRRAACQVHELMAGDDGRCVLCRRRDHDRGRMPRTTLATLAAMIALLLGWYMDRERSAWLSSRMVTTLELEVDADEIGEALALTAEFDEPESASQRSLHLATGALSLQLIGATTSSGAVDDGRDVVERWRRQHAALLAELDNPKAIDVNAPPQQLAPEPPRKLRRRRPRPWRPAPNPGGTDELVNMSHRPGDSLTRRNARRGGSWGRSSSRRTASSRQTASSRRQVRQPTSHRAQPRRAAVARRTPQQQSSRWWKPRRKVVAPRTGIKSATRRAAPRTVASLRTTGAQRSRAGRVHRSGGSVGGGSVGGGR